MAIYNSSSINRDGFARGIGVYPIKVLGTITVASNITLSSTTTDTLPICLIPQNCFISDWKFYFPVFGTSAAMKLVDTLSSVTTYCAVITQCAAGGVASMSATPAVADQPTQGTIYGGTARTIGATGAPVVVWASGVKLQLAVTTSSASTTGATAVNINYMIEFSPMYDGGV